MKIFRITAVLTTLAVLAVAGCSASQSGAVSQPTQPPPSQRPVVLTASQVSELRGLGAADTGFGLGLMGSLCQAQPGQNVVISPVSLATGLGMAEIGARGATAAAMARVLGQVRSGAAPPVPELTASFAARTALLGSLNRPGVTFNGSNRIWADPIFHTNSSFVAALRSADKASLRTLPLRSQPERSRQIINAAIAAQTGGHIPNLLPPAAMTPPPGWVLTDALYLNAAWQHPFDHGATAAGPFRTQSGAVSVKYLNGEGFASASAGGWQAATLPYRGGRLSMLALLPPAGGVKTAAGCQLPGTVVLSQLTSQLAAGKGLAAVSLPKINISTSASLREVLTALGMGIAFSGQADFTGISPQAGSIGWVQHAATLSVGEKGTVASAATAVVILPGAALLKQVRFDRPYLLLLRDSLTGEPLMLAWVANPATS